MADHSSCSREPPPLRFYGADGSMYWTAERIEDAVYEPPAIERLYLSANEFAGPLWDERESIGLDADYLRETLGLSPELVDALDAWNRAHYARHYSREHPLDVDALAEERLRLLTRLGAEVVEGVTVMDSER